MSLVIPNRTPLEAPKSPKIEQSPVQLAEQRFWVKLLKIREYQAVCKVHVYHDESGKEYRRIDTIIEIDRDKKKQQKEEKKEKTTTAFLEDIEE